MTEFDRIAHFVQPYLQLGEYVSLVLTSKSINRTLDNAFLHELNMHPRCDSPATLRFVNKCFRRFPNIYSLIIMDDRYYLKRSQGLQISEKSAMSSSNLKSQPSMESLVPVLEEVLKLRESYAQTTKIQMLDIRSARLLGSDMFTVVSSCGLLRHLNLSNCSYLDDCRLGSLVERTPVLESLSIQNGFLLRRPSLNCGLLKYLQFRQCPRLVAVHGPVTLESLNLNATAISSEFLNVS